MDQDALPGLQASRLNQGLVSRTVVYGNGCGRFEGHAHGDSMDQAFGIADEIAEATQFVGQHSIPLFMGRDLAADAAHDPTAFNTDRRLGDLAQGNHDVHEVEPGSLDFDLDVVVGEGVVVCRVVFEADRVEHAWG